MPPIVAVLACLVLAIHFTTTGVAAHQPTTTPKLYYSTEVAPAAECDVDPIDPTVVRDAAARVYAHPIDIRTPTRVAEPSPIGISYWTAIPNQSLNVYVDGEPFIERGRPVDGVPANPGGQVDAATVQGIQDTIRTAIACWNTGDPTRSIALYTVHGIEEAIESSREYGDPPAEQSDFEDISIASGEIPDDQYWLAPAIGDVRVSRDGTAVVYGLLSLNLRSLESEPTRAEPDVLKLRLVDGA